MDLTKNLAQETNKHFCILPWVHLDIQPNGGCRTCCLIRQDTFGNIKDQKLKEIVNSSEQKNLRANMLAGKFSGSCIECYKDETSGHVSLRQRANKAFYKYDGLLESTSIDGIVDDFRLKHVTLRFSNLCNLSCVYCSSLYSTAIKDEGNTGYIKSFENIKDLEQFIDENCEYTEVFDLMGGEAILDPLHNEFLNLMIQKGKTNITLLYTTNLSIDLSTKPNLLEKWKQFKEVGFIVSLDAEEKLGEEIRRGLKWDIALKNIAYVKANLDFRHFIIQPTVSILNIFNLAKFINYLLKNELVYPSNVVFNYLYRPMKYSLETLNKYQTIEIVSSLKDLKKTLIMDYEINQVAGLIKNLNALVVRLEQGQES
jgi:MoaA/NifB/PqqE/SkfB family radical SAM enzyme